VFSPAAAGVGTHVIVYQGQTSGGCAYRSERVVEVVSTQARIDGLSGPYCAGGGPVALSGFPAGGAFSGPGVSGNVFSPAVAGPGAHAITYFGVLGPCTYSTTVQVVVQAPVTVSATASNGVVTVMASGGQAPYQYSLDGGPLVGTNVFSGVSAGAHTVLVRDAMGCQGVATVTVAAEGCATPTNLTVVPGTTTAQVSWSGNATRYLLAWRKDVAGEPWISTNVNGTSFTLSNLTPGVRYQVRVRARCGTESSAWSETVVFITRAQREEVTEATAAQVQVYPNPNRGVFTVRGAAGAELTLHDVTGRALWTQRTNEAETPVVLEGYAAGVYVLTVRQADGATHSLRVIVQQ